MRPDLAPRGNATTPTVRLAKAWNTCCMACPSSLRVAPLPTAFSPPESGTFPSQVSLKPADDPVASSGPPVSLQIIAGGGDGGGRGAFCNSPHPAASLRANEGDAACAVWLGTRPGESSHAGSVESAESASTGGGAGGGSGCAILCPRLRDLAGQPATCSGGGAASSGGASGGNGGALAKSPSSMSSSSRRSKYRRFSSMPSCRARSCASSCCACSKGQRCGACALTVSKADHAARPLNAAWPPGLAALRPPAAWPPSRQPVEISPIGLQPRLLCRPAAIHLCCCIYCHPISTLRLSSRASTSPSWPFLALRLRAWSSICTNS
mmetsp:Transcript_29159/g.93014  ORF Transcript_29159/g.93014 Transcript_29159/m.93014 type:complete len:323 (-) Transcript_29159:625-1593(-)